MSKVRITKRAFNILLEALKSQFERECMGNGEMIPSGIGREYFGFDQNDSEPSLMRSILENSQVMNYVREKKIKKFSRKYLYNINLEFKKKNDLNDVVDFDSNYLNAFVRYIDPQESIDSIDYYPGFENFVIRNPSFTAIERDIQLTILRSRKDELTHLATRYKAIYFGYGTDKIKSFYLTIDFFNPTNDKYPAKVEGLHNEIEKKRSSHIYVGKAWQGTSSFFVNLIEANELPLNIIGYTSHMNAKDMKTILACYQGISIYGYPICAEAVLIRLDDNKEETAEERESIDLYLRIQRRSFRIPPRIHIDGLQLKARGVWTSELLYIKGQYRIWNFDRSGNIIQSRFIINSDFSATLETVPKIKNEEKQICVFSFSRVRNKKLCVSSHPEQGVSVINYAIIDIARIQHNIVDGVFCSVGPDNKTGLVSGYMALLKDDSQFEVMSLDKSDFNVLVNENPFLNYLWERLKKWHDQDVQVNKLIEEWID